jgi:hypothetical protein
MPHDNYSTAADKVFHDGTLFPQPRNHICGAKALRPRAAGQAAGTRVGVRLMIEPKPY